jgi:hypothetical protein
VVWFCKMKNEWVSKAVLAAGYRHDVGEFNGA